MQPGIAAFWVLTTRQSWPPATHFAGVAHLAAHLGIKRRGVENDRGLVFDAQRLRAPWPCVSRASIADEIACGVLVSIWESSMTSFFCAAAGAGALLFHQLFEPGDVHRQAALARHQFGQVERETVGVVEFEGKFAGLSRCRPLQAGLDVSSRNSSMPRSSVLLNASSSRWMTSSTCSCLARISGKTSPMVSASTSTSL